MTLAQNLLAHLDPAHRAAVLVTGEHPERMAFVLAHLGFSVDIADPQALAQRTLAACDWRAEFAPEGWVSPRPVGLINERAAAIEAGFRYDAVIIPQNGLFARGRAAGADLLAQARRPVEGRRASRLYRPGAAPAPGRAPCKSTPCRSA